MKTHEVDHGHFMVPRYRFDTKTLRQYRDSLKPGKKVNIKRIVEGADKKPKVTREEAAVVRVYPYVTLVDQAVTVKRCGIPREITRRTSYTNAELMIWNMGEEDDLSGISTDEN